MPTLAVPGHRCRTCRHPVTGPYPRCPDCGGELAPAQFAATGTIWSATVVRIDLPGHPAPRVLAYVDLDDGPRILARVDSGELRAPRPGERVHVTDATSRPPSVQR